LSIVPLSVRNVVVSVSELDVGARGASLPSRRKLAADSLGRRGATVRSVVVAAQRRGRSVQLNGRTSKSIVPLSARNGSVVVSVSELDVGARAASLPLLRRESQRKRQHALLVLPPRRAQYRIAREPRRQRSRRGLRRQRSRREGRPQRSGRNLRRQRSRRDLHRQRSRRGCTRHDRRVPVAERPRLVVRSAPVAPVTIVGRRGQRGHDWPSVPLRRCGADPRGQRLITQTLTVCTVSSNLRGP